LVMRDRGSAAILTVLVVLACTFAVVSALVPVATSLIDRQHAQSAADAAALAGVTGGRAAATELAAANGGALVGWSVDGHRVTVRVRIGDQVAVARATDEP